MRSYDKTPLAIIDTGGNDTYTGRAARGPGKPVSLTIDWSGNDTYLANDGPAVAAGVCGIDILIDYAGDDLYSVSRWGLGAGYFGRGMLVDHTGNDRYIGERFVQVYTRVTSSTSPASKRSINFWAICCDSR